MGFLKIQNNYYYVYVYSLNIGNLSKMKLQSTGHGVVVDGNLVVVSCGLSFALSFCTGGGIVVGGMKLGCPSCQLP